MATVQALLAKKGGQVVTIGVADSALTAATLMNERGIGGLVVLDGGRVAGMFTERDILRRVVAMRRDPAATPVSEVMTTPVAFCRLETTLSECRAVMTEKRIRHLPVVGEKGVCGSRLFAARRSTWASYPPQARSIASAVICTRSRA